MIGKLRSFIVVAGIALRIGMLSPIAVGAASVLDRQCAGVTESAFCDRKDASPEDLAMNIVNSLLFVVGTVPS